MQPDGDFRSSCRDHGRNARARIVNTSLPTIIFARLSGHPSRSERDSFPALSSRAYAHIHLHAYTCAPEVAILSPRPISSRRPAPPFRSTTRFSRGCRRWNVNTPRPIGFMVIAAARSRGEGTIVSIARVPSMRGESTVSRSRNFCDFHRARNHEASRRRLPSISVSQPNRSGALPARRQRRFNVCASPRPFQGILYRTGAIFNDYTSSTDN